MTKESVQFMGTTEFQQTREDGRNGHYAILGVGPFTNKEAARYYLKNTMQKRIN